MSQDMFFDIETIPSQSEFVKREIAEQIEQACAEIKAPGNYKDPVKIQEYIQNEQAKIIADADATYRKTALDGSYGEIICIGWAAGDADTVSASREISVKLGETQVLREFFEAYMDAANEFNRAPKLIGHNIIGFDLRFLWQRAAVLGVKAPRAIQFDARYNNERVYDTMQAWCGWGKYIKLDKLCRVLGVPGKMEGMDGSKVWDEVLAGNVDKVTDYCRHDVDATRACYRKLMAAGG